MLKQLRSVDVEAEARLDDLKSTHVSKHMFGLALVLGVLSKTTGKQKTMSTVYVSYYTFGIAMVSV